MSEYTVSSPSSYQDPWITQFCEARHHLFFCAVREEFIEDDFNLTGLSQHVPRYKEALELILDLEPDQPIPLPDIPSISESGELLYGLIHARYIVTRAGLTAMASKYDCLDFGTCPRVMCENTGLLPIGRHDMPGYEPVRLFCPCCRDIYLPRSSRFLNIDGAFFGSSFPGMFLEYLPEIEQRCYEIRRRQFTLKLHGFRISEISAAGPRMKWLRHTPETDAVTKLEDERAAAEEQQQSSTI